MVRAASSGLFLSVILFYLLPWVKIGALGLGISLSGIDLVIGKEIGGKVMGQEFRERVLEPEPFVITPLIMALAGVGFSFFKGRSGNIGRATAGALGAILLAIVAFGVNSVVSEQGWGLVEASYLAGFWLAFLAFLAAAGLGILGSRAISTHDLLSGIRAALNTTATLETGRISPVAQEKGELAEEVEEEKLPATAKPEKESWQVITRLARGGVALIGLLVLSGILGTLPGMKTRIGGMNLGQLAGLMLAGLMIWIIVSRVNALATVLGHYQARPLERFGSLKTLSQATLSQVWQSLSLVIALILCWLVIVANLGTLSRLLGGWIVLASTLGFLAGLAFPGFRIYRLLGSLIEQWVRARTTGGTTET